MYKCRDEAGNVEGEKKEGHETDQECALLFAFFFCSHTRARKLPGTAQKRACFFPFLSLSIFFPRSLALLCDLMVEDDSVEQVCY